MAQTHSLKKNDTIELEITGFTSEGSGVGRAEDMAVFVPLTAPGDVVSCRTTRHRARLIMAEAERVIHFPLDSMSPCWK